MPDAYSSVRVHERAVLRKFDGDPAPEAEPVEVVLVEDGRIVQRWTGDEVRNAPTE